MRVHGYGPSPGSVIWALVSIAAFLAMVVIGVRQACRGRVGWRWVIVWALAVVLAFGFAAFAHDPYSGWRQPGTGKSCCDNRDCRPVRAYLGDDGLHYILLNERWQPVPRDRVLQIPSPDLSAHACVNDETDEIHCFVAGPGGT